MTAPGQLEFVGDPRELEKRLAAILEAAIEGGKFHAGRLTGDAKAEYRSLHPLWVEAKR